MVEYDLSEPEVRGAWSRYISSLHHVLETVLLCILPSMSALLMAVKFLQDC